jgi:RimJ/RimL family protein N-acetyltransferase
MNNTIILNTPRLKLIEIHSSDLKTIHELHSLPETDEYNTLGIPESPEITQKVMQPYFDDQKMSVRKMCCWKIVLRESGTFIGLAGMHLSNDRFRLGEIYYKLFPAYWDLGYATETAKCLVLAGFNQFGLHKVEAGVATENNRSVRVLEKIGMTCEGVRRKILPIRGEWKDNYHYAIVEDDPREY